MNKEDLKNKVKEVLLNMGYTNIAFSNGEENLLVASFDSTEITSFKTELEGWIYSGIQLNTGVSGQYKIEFRKTV